MRIHKPILIGAISALLVMALIANAILGRADRSHRETLTEHLDSLRVRLESQLYGRLHMVEGLAAFVRTHDAFSDEQFEQFALALERGRKGIRSLQLAPDAVVRYLTHPERNTAARGHDLLGDPARRDLVQKAIDERTYIIAGPLNLIQGGIGLIGRLPIYVPDDDSPTGDSFWGFSTILLEVEPLLAEAGITTNDADLEFGLRGKDGLGATGDAFFGTSELFGTEAVIVDVNIPNGTWQLTARPRPGSMFAASSDPLLWLGAILMALLAGGVVYLSVQRPQALRSAADQAVAALQESEDRVRRIAANLPGAVYRRVLHANGNVSYPFISAGYNELVGCNERELAEHARELKDLFALRLDAASRERWQATTTESAAKLQPYDITLRLELPSGKSTYVRSLAIAQRAPNGDCVWDGILLDITDQRSAEEQLRQTSKMEALGQLTGGIAHDFNNLLAIVVGNLEVGLADAADDEMRDTLNDAMDAATRGSNLTQSLLTFARRQRLSPQHTDLSELAHAAEPMLKTTLGATVELQYDLEPEPWPASVDPSLLSNALLNLAINARDAMPKGGTLRVATRNLVNRDAVELTVTDTGDGMPPEVLERVFEPFFTTKSVGRGSGLGLSMVYGFVDQSGGEVEIESEPGKGTSVSLQFPRSTAPPEPVAAPIPPQPVDAPAENEGHGRTVLVTEDDEDVRRIIVKQLKRRGYRVLEAGNASSALAAYEHHTIDLMLTDIVMPGGIDGFALGAHVRREHPATKVLFMSGNQGTTDATPPPDILLLRKPILEQDLAAALRRELGD